MIGALGQNLNRTKQLANGKCGKDNNTALCTDIAKRTCCSATGFCGSGQEHCMGGCQYGPCVQ